MPPKKRQLTSRNAGSDTDDTVVSRTTSKLGTVKRAKPNTSSLKTPSRGNPSNTRRAPKFRRTTNAPSSSSHQEDDDEEDSEDDSEDDQKFVKLSTARTPRGKAQAATRRKMISSSEDDDDDDDDDEEEEEEEERAKPIKPATRNSKRGGAGNRMVYTSSSSEDFDDSDEQSESEEEEEPQTARRRGRQSVVTPSSRSNTSSKITKTNKNQNVRKLTNIPQTNSQNSQYDSETELSESDAPPARRVSRSHGSRVESKPSQQTKGNNNNNKKQIAKNPPTSESSSSEEDDLGDVTLSDDPIEHLHMPTPRGRGRQPQQQQSAAQRQVNNKKQTPAKNNNNKVKIQSSAYDSSSGDDDDEDDDDDDEDNNSSDVDSDDSSRSTRSTSRGRGKKTTTNNTNNNNINNNNNSRGNKVVLTTTTTTTTKTTRRGTNATAATSTTSTNSNVSTKKQQPPTTPASRNTTQQRGGARRNNRNFTPSDADEDDFSEDDDGDDDATTTQTEQSETNSSDFLSADDDSDDSDGQKRVRPVLTQTPQLAQDRSNFDHRTYHDFVVRQNKIFQANNRFKFGFEGSLVFYFHNPMMMTLDAILEWDNPWGDVQTAQLRGVDDTITALVNYRTLLNSQLKDFQKLGEERERFKTACQQRKTFTPRPVPFPRLHPTGPVRFRRVDLFAISQMDEVYCPHCNQFDTYLENHQVTHSHPHHYLCYCLECSERFDKVEEWLLQTIKRIKDRMVAWGPNYEVGQDVEF